MKPLYTARNGSGGQWYVALEESETEISIIGAAATKEDAERIANSMDQLRTEIERRGAIIQNVALAIGVDHLNLPLLHP
jgi:hypothetical protein